MAELPGYIGATESLTMLIIDLDHSQEWLNGSLVGPTGEKACGIVGKNRHYQDHPFEMDPSVQFQSTHIGTNTANAQCRGQ